MAMAIIKTAQSVKPLPALALVQVPPSLFPVNTSGKAVAGGLQAGVPATCFGDLDGIPGFGLTQLQPLYSFEQ